MASLSSPSGVDKCLRVTTILRHTNDTIKPVTYSFQDRAMVIAGQAAAQGDTLIYRGDKSLRWVIHDNVLELYENEVFHITIYFDTPVVPGAFVDYDDNEIFTLALATHRKVYSAKLVISSLSSDFEAVLRSIASAAHSTPDEVFVRSAYLPESSDQGSLFALTSAGSAYVSKVEFFCYSMEASNSSGNSLTLEKLAAPTITNGSGSGATSFIKGLFWGRPAEEHRGDKALGICPLEASQSTAYFATVHEDLMLRVWAANSKAPLASFPLDGTAHYSADSCNVRLCTLRKVYSNQNESNGYVYHQLVVGVLLESRDGSSTVLKVFVPQIIAGSKSYTITKPFTYEKLFSRTVRRVLGGEDSDGDETETPSQVVINCIRGNDDSRLLLYLYYRFKGHHFELVTMANSDDNSTEYIQQQHQQPQNIVVDNDSAPICGITLNKSWNTVMCTTESSTDVVRLSTAQEALPRNHINNGSVVKELTSDIDKLFAFDGHKKDINAVATAVSNKVKAFVKSGHLSATAAADEDAIIAEINEAVKATPKTEWEKSGDVEMEKEGEKEGEKAKTGRLFNVYVSSLLVQLYESQYQTCRALLIRFNALDDKANKRTENKELISTMIQLKLFVHILSTKNSKGENILVNKCFSKGCTNWMAQDGDYYLKTMNEEFNKTFGAKESFTAFLTTLFKEKMFTHAIEIINYFDEYECKETMELKAKCQLELGDVSASYDTFVECSEKLIRSNGDVTAQAEFLHTAVMIYASKQLYKFVEQVADYGIAVTQKDISNLNEEYFYFLRVKFDSSIVTHNFKGVSDVLHLSPLYFARAPELMSHFVKAVLATAQQSPNSGDQEEILFAVCNDGFRRVIFKALFRLGLTAPTVGALRSDPSKNPFEVAYKIAAKQGDYQTAAAAMFFYAKKARLEAHLRPVKGPNTSTTLSLAKSLYGRALAALRLIDDVDSRWILNTPANTLLPFSDEERKASSSSSSQQSIVCTKRKIEEKEEEEEEEEEGTAEISLDVCKVQMFGEHKYWDDDESANDVITVERLERVLITVSCEYALASERDNIVLNATAEHNWREQLAEVLAENRLIDEAFLLGKAYPELNVHVFELLKMCVVDPSALAAGEKVHEYLRRFQKADYYKAVLYGIMNAHVGYEMRVVESSADLTALGGKCITTPLWFLKEFLAVCPTDLFDVLLEFDLFYAIDRMLDIADRGDVPYLILERIEHVLRDPSCKAAPDLKESIARKVKSLVAK